MPSNTQRGFSPWLDEEDLIPGEIWEIEIQNVIREAGAFIACLSQISLRKQGFVQAEFRLALTAYGERPPGVIYFIPVKLDECEIPDLQIPKRGLSIRDFQWLDLWQEGGFERLIRALEKGLGTTGRATPNGARGGELARHDLALHSSEWNAHCLSRHKKTLILDLRLNECKTIVELRSSSITFFNTEVFLNGKNIS